MQDKVFIVGIAPGGAGSLPVEARRLVEGAGIIFGGRRLLDLFPSAPGEKIPIKDNLAGVAALVKQNLGRKLLVVLASGDPGFYGIAGYLTARLGKDSVEIVPNVSAMQVAFARIKESWEDARLVSVHSRPIEDIVEAVRSSHKVAIFTDDRHTPSAVARVLLEHGVDGYRAYVCQDLGGKDEEVVETDLQGLCEKSFHPLNVLILLADRREPAPGPGLLRLGIPDREFYQRRPKEGLITKQEVRAVSLARLRLAGDSVLWDIGAGSGAVSIEAAAVIRTGRIYAVEKNGADVAIIRQNIEKFRVPNIEVVHAFAPDGLDTLPRPDAVFVGGSGGRMEDILGAAGRRLRPGGRIVINVVALENLGAAVSALTARGFVADIALVSIARGTGITGLTRLEALNPVFVVSAARAEEKVT